MILYVRGRNSYFSLDVPTMGKFEYGSNGNIAWQRSVVLGPKLMPRSQFNGFLGPDVGEILTWTDEGLTVRTVRKEQVDGSSCYVVEMGAKKEGTFTEAYFDAKTGYLVRMNTPARAGAAAEQIRLGDYRTENGFTIAHHIETTLAGKAVSITITEVHLNASIPDSIFDVPEDVTALLQQQQVQRTDPDLSARPTLRRLPVH